MCVNNGKEAEATCLLKQLKQRFKEQSRFKSNANSIPWNGPMERWHYMYPSFTRRQR